MQGEGPHRQPERPVLLRRAQGLGDAIEDGGGATVVLVPEREEPFDLVGRR